MKQRKFRVVLRVTLTVFWYPALLYHEFSHAVMVMLFFLMPMDIEVRFQFSKPLHGAVFHKPNEIMKGWSKFLVCFAPLMMLMLIIALAFLFPSLWFVAGYLILAFHYALPSNNDVNLGLKCLGSTREFSDYKKEKSIFEYLYPEWTLKRNEEDLSVISELLADKGMREDRKTKLQLESDMLISER